MTNPSQEPSRLDTQIPHTGSDRVDESMRDFHPTGEFDSYDLGKIANETTSGGENIITVPESPATNPDSLREAYNMPAVIPAEEHRDSKNDKKGKKIGMIAGGAVAAVGLVGAGFAMGNSGSESNDIPSDNQASTEVVQGSQADNILDTPPTETTITVESNETSDKDGELAEMEPWEEFEEIQRTLWEYNTLEVQEVTADRAEDYIRELNYLIAIALIDTDQDRATQAISALTNDSPHAEQFVQFLEQYRENNLELSRTAGIKDTFVAEPGTIETLDTGDGYAIITSSNVTLRVRDNGSSYPQPADNTRGTTYYYVRIEDSGEKYLMGAFDTLADWDGQSAPMS